jgi:hypothetical protein
MHHASFIDIPLSIIHTTPAGLTLVNVLSIKVNVTIDVDYLLILPRTSVGERGRHTSASFLQLSSAHVTETGIRTIRPKA